MPPGAEELQFDPTDAEETELAEQDEQDREGEQSKQSSEGQELSELEEAQRAARLENLAANQDLGSFFRAVDAAEEARVEDPGLNLDKAVQQAAENYLTQNFPDENYDGWQLIAHSSVLIRLARSRRIIETMYFKDQKDNSEVRDVVDAIAMSIHDRLLDGIKINPKDTLEKQLKAIEQVSEEDIKKILGDFSFEMTDEDLGQVMDFDEAHLVVRVSRPALQKMDPEERADLYRLARGLRQTMGFEARSRDDDGWVQEIDTFDPEDPGSAEENREYILREAEKMGISEIDLQYFQLFRNKKNAFVLARALIDINNDPLNPDDEEINNIKSVGLELVQKASEERASDIRIPADFLTNNKMRALIMHFIGIWNKIQSRPDIFNEQALSLLSLGDPDIDMDVGGNGTSSNEEGVDKGAGGDKEKKVTGGKERADSGKSQGPKNMKEAFIAMFKAVDSDILSQLNLPGDIVNDLAGGKAA